MKSIIKEYSLLIFFILAGITVIAVSFYTRSIVNFFVTTSEENVKEKLRVASSVLATMTTPEELDLFKSPEDAQQPEWEALRQRLMSFAREANVLYTYYVRIEGGDVQYIADNDLDEEFRVGIDTLPEKLSEHPEKEEAWTYGRVVVTGLGIYSGGWEGLVSAYAPIFYSDGSIAALAGVDIHDGEMLRLRSLEQVLWILNIVVAMAVLGCGTYGFIKYRREAITAKTANAAKGNFLASMSHEIRTPMNAIIGIAQIELQKGGLTNELATALDKIYSSGTNLLGIINDILDMSKIETGRLELHPVDYDVPSLINDTVQLNIVRIGSKPVEFILDVSPNLPSRMFGDELRIKQILNNLLSNAIKYTDEGHIKLTVRHIINGDDILMKFEVKDTGQGMKPHDIERIFFAYSRLNMEANHTVEGTGLGLNITRNLVQMMGGTIKAESEYGRGSVFTVKFTQKRVRSSAIGPELAERLRTFNFMGEKQTAKFQFIRNPMPYGRVLVVDDVDTNLYVAQGLMAPYRLNVDTAVSGFETIERVESGETYDIIFMDHMMPYMDGIEATQKLRSLGYTGIIVALTANAIAGNDEMFMQNGFDGFISKPVDIRELDSALNKFVRDRHPDEAKNHKPNTFEQAYDDKPDINPKLLEIFCRDAVKAIATLRKTGSNGDIKLFTTTAHAMKSALANIGEAGASQKAFALEKAGIDKNVDLIAALAEDFIETLEALVQRITPPNITADGDTSAGAPEDGEYLKTQLLAIKEACEDYDRKTAFTALDLLMEKQWKTDTSAALESIRDALMLHSDFEEAAEQAAKLLERSPVSAS